jgi:raffinose/stachyose/melibiose transport system permease protein
MNKKIISISKYIILILYAITCIYPMVWLVLSSFKTNEELFRNTWGFPEMLRISNYMNAIVQGSIGKYFLNSVIVSVIAVFLCVLLGSMASYAIVRMKWKLSGIVLKLFLMGMMVPIYATIVPLFSIFNNLRILNTHASVIIPQVAFGFPMVIFILTGFLSTIPSELEEAAIMDGCNIFQIFYQIIMPITKPSLVTVAVITFLDVWNDLLIPQIFLTSSDKMTLPVGLTEFQGLYSTDYVSTIAAVVITVVPSIIVYIILHKNIMEGMVTGAVKG